MGLTSIEWTGRSWNCIKARLKQDLTLIAKSGEQRIIPAGKVGYHCERVSEGCRNCYACTMNGRTLPAWGTGLNYTVPNRNKVEIFLDEKVLFEPLSWKKPTKVFPCSMTDWAADFVTDEMMDRMLAVAALTPWHTYQFLTKRPERLVQYALSESQPSGINRAIRQMMRDGIIPAAHEDDKFPWTPWPPPNCQWGFSAEDQPNFDARWKHMRKLAREDWFTWVSLEPLLGPIDCGDALEVWRDHGELLSWGVIGGESGPCARPCQLEWIGKLIDEFSDTKVPLFVKQAGSIPISGLPTGGRLLGNVTLSSTGDLAAGWEVKMADRKGGAMSEWPEWMRVRQFPESRHA